MLREALAIEAQKKYVRPALNKPNKRAHPSTYMKRTPRLTRIDFSMSLGLQAEIAAIGRARADTPLPATPEEYAAEFLAGSHGAEVRYQAAQLTPGSRVLDIGVGNGASSVFLASLGHEVTVIEPSPALCERLHRAAEAYDLQIDIYIANAESVDCIPGVFDDAVFCSSLHHCDDPIGALRRLSMKLRPGGRVFVLNEPILQCYRSKAWFFRMIAEHPEEMGHYGGNEHIYRYSEYAKFLQVAGFSLVSAQPHQSVRSASARLALWANRPGARFHHRQRAIKWCYYGIVAFLVRFAPLCWLLRRSSLLPISFVAVRR